MALAVVATLAPRQHSRDVKQIIAELRRENPKANAECLAALLAEELRDDDELLLSVAGDLVRKSLTPAKPKPTLKAAEAARRQRVARQEAEKTVARQIAGKVKEIILLDIPVMLLDGTQKQLRYATKVELNQLGGLYIQLAARLEAPDEMCGERWTDGELKALLQAAV